MPRTAKDAPLAGAAPSYRHRAWRDAPREVLHNAWRYSVFVKVMKGALPVMALGLGALVLVYTMQPRETDQVALTFEQLGRVENDLAMVNPQLTGTGDDGMPFKITAATAIQEERGSDRVRLEDVVAEIGLKGGGTLHVKAARGLADTRQHLLDVSGGIELTSDKGYEATTESASADLKAGVVTGESPIEANGKFGRVTAQRFAFNQATGELRFSGNVHMILNGAAGTP